MQLISGEEKPLAEALVEGDTGYFAEENLQDAARRGIEVLIPDPQFRRRDEAFEERKRTQARYSVEDFTYDDENDRYVCPAGKVLTCKGKIKLRNNEGKKYQARAKDCGECRYIDRCINIRTDRLKKRSKRTRTLYIAERKYEENLSKKMKEKIDEPAWRELYTRRQQIIEPVFANITYCKGMDRFTLRGKTKVNIQWQLYCVVHNIGKCIKPVKKEYQKRRKRNKKMRLLCAS
jgi:hypothetical protein